MHRNRFSRTVARLALVLTVLLFYGAAAGPQVQTRPRDEQVWQDFLTWFRAAPAGPDALRAYAVELGRQGVPDQEIERRTGVIMRLLATRPEGIEIFYDKTFSRPLTGKPEQDGFNSAPSAFLLEAVKDVPRGKALDVGMGQGRNAVALARLGWNVTGFDISREAIVAALKNARIAGVSLTAARSDYAAFDFGREVWDLVAMIFAWAPVADPTFVEKIRASLKTGGLVIFEHFIDDPARPYPPMVRALPPGALRDCFSGFDIVRYEEIIGTGDWGGPDSRLVRMIARKR